MLRHDEAGTVGALTTHPVPIKACYVDGSQTKVGYSLTKYMAKRHERREDGLHVYFLFRCLRSICIGGEGSKSNDVYAVRQDGGVPNITSIAHISNCQLQ